VVKLEEKWWGCKTTSSRCPWVLNVEIRGCLHDENKSIISKILIFVSAFAPTIYNIASPMGIGFIDMRLFNQTLLAR
jgi:hypothetical protein